MLALSFSGALIQGEGQLPYSLHLAVDGAVGVIFLAAPFVLSFGGLDAVYYWLNGAAVVLVVSLHQSENTAVAA